MDRSVAQEAVFQDLHTWGADLLENFKERVGEANANALILDGFVKVAKGNTFNYVALGREGRNRSA